MDANLVFYVVINEKTGLFLKKTARTSYSYSLNGKTYNPNGFWTPKIGQARIFSSEAMALVGFNKDDGNAKYQVVAYSAAPVSK